MRPCPRPLCGARPGMLGPLLLALLVACGGDEAVSPEAGIEFMVGDWAAASFVVQPAGGQSVDIIDAGASFTLNVQPSGQYTARLVVPGLGAAPEIGMLAVVGDELVFTRTVPAPTTVTRATFERLGTDRVRFWGPSEFDLDGDGASEPVDLTIEIVRTG